MIFSSGFTGWNPNAWIHSEKYGIEIVKKVSKLWQQKQKPSRMHKLKLPGWARESKNMETQEYLQACHFGF